MNTLKALLVCTLFVPTMLNCASEAPAKVLNAVYLRLHEMSKKNGPEVSRAIFDYYQSIKDPKYKIKLSSSIQLLTESNVVAVSNGGKKTFAQVQAAIRDAYQAVYGTGK